MRKGSLPLLLAFLLGGTPAVSLADDGAGVGPGAAITTGHRSSAPLPAGFALHRVEGADSWESLARLYGQSAGELRQLNGGSELVVGSEVRIPPPRFGWPAHTVRSGETLWRIGQGYGVSVVQLQQVNGLSDHRLLRGQRLLLPRGERPTWSEPPPPAAERTTPAAVGLEPVGEEPSTAPPTPPPTTSTEAPGSGLAGEVSEVTARPTLVPEVKGGGQGWVEVRLDNGRRAWAPLSALVVGSWQPQPPEAVLETAVRFHGVPYRWGGVDPNGYDCSGFVHEVFRLNGHEIPRMADHQQEGFVAVDRDDLQLGDLVFFDPDGSGISHVGIYAGEGRFVHASTSRGVITSSLEEGYYQRSYHSGGRLPLWAEGPDRRSAAGPAPSSPQP